MLDAPGPQSPKSPQCLLISAGGSMAPVKTALEILQPLHAIFFVSRESRALIQAELKPDLPHGFVCLAEAGDEQNLDACIQLLIRKVPQRLKEMNLATLQWPDQVDFTGGTKVMSAALVWSALHHASALHYIGSQGVVGRDKAGVGRVRDGHEAPKPQAHQRILYHLEMEAAETAYKQERFELAAHHADRAVSFIADDPPLLDRARALREALSGLAHRDRFAFKSALPPLNRALKTVGTAHRVPNTITDRIFSELLETLQTCQRLSQNQEDPHEEIIRELWQNARRRMREHRYDDATARWYALLEQIFQYRLLTNHGIRTGSCPPEKIPDALREEFKNRYAKEDGTLCFGVQTAARLLHVLQDALIQDPGELKQLKNLLELRNQSILAHGIRAVSAEKAEALSAQVEIFLHRLLPENH